MYVEKRISGTKVKFYLAHSFREGKKVHKISKYLGMNLAPHLIEERKKIAQRLILDEINRYRVINDPLIAELSSSEIQWVKNLEIQIPINVSHLSERQWRLFSELFTYNTNAIEGSRLNSREVNEILEKDKWPEKSKEDIAEAYGVNEAIRFIRKTKTHVSIGLKKRIHRTVFGNSKLFAGQLRKPGEEVVVMDGRGNVVHEGAPQPRIRYLLNQLVRWYDKNKKRYPPLILAAVIHNQFENIHPFRDGNGRVGRILLNNILIKHNLPPINIELKNRIEYYLSLQAYEKNHDLRPTLKLFMKEYAALKKALGDYRKRKV